MGDLSKRRSTGTLSAADSDAIDVLPCGCVICEECRAARVLQPGRSNWLDTSSLDADLQRVIVAWDLLPEAVRTAVLALIGA